MKNIKIVSLIISSLILNSCLNLRSCPEEISGKFVCKNNPSAENYLLLNKDGTFEHFYKEDSITLKQNGTWKRSNDGYCKIELSEWNSYNENGADFEKFGNGLFWINGKYLDMTPDGNSRSSFEKFKK